MKLWFEKKEEVAEDTFMFKFRPESDVSFRPGQYIRLKIPLEYEDTKGDERFFSIINPDENKIQIATRMTESGFKKTLYDMEPGIEVWVSEIAGDFTLPYQKEKEIVMLAGGIGITPFKCILENLFAKGNRRKIQLIYSNKSKSTTAFFERLRFLGDELPNLNVDFIMTRDEEWDGKTGRIDANFIQQEIKFPNNKHFMIAGPPAFVSAMRNEFKSIGVEDINYEEFIGY